MNDLKDINTNKDLLSSLDNNDENNNISEDEIEEKEIVFFIYIPQNRKTGTVFRRFLFFQER